MKFKKRMSSAVRSDILIIASMALGAAIHHTVVSLRQKKNNSVSSIGRHPGKAWTLVVTLKFKSALDQENILREWKPVTKYCAENEPFLYHYEAGRSDSDPLTVHMVERYKTKEDYLNKHKASEEFLNFRHKLKALQDAGKVSIEGFSYQELGYGFV